MQQQPIIGNEVLSTEGSLELRLLDAGISVSDILRCVEAHNSEWGRFFELTSETMKQRLGSGELFLGAYKGGSLVGYLEMMSHHVEIPDIPAGLEEPDINTAQRVIRLAADQIKGNYFKHSPNGIWPDRPASANLIRLVSINVLPEEREYGYGGQMIEYVKRVLRMAPEQRPIQLRDTVITLTDTPTKRLPQKFHIKYYALDSQCIEPNFRPGYDAADIRRFCYSAPGFKAPLGTRSN